MKRNKILNEARSVIERIERKRMEIKYLNGKSESLMSWEELNRRVDIAIEKRNCDDICCIFRPSDRDEINAKFQEIMARENKSCLKIA